MIKLSASSMPRGFACPPSVTGDEIMVSVSNDAGNLGNAAHEAMEASVIGEVPDLDQIADRWGADRDDLGRLAWYGRKAWEELEPSFPHAETEVAYEVTLPEFRLRCRVDVVSPHPRRVRGLDWKFGQVDGDYYHQLAADAACIMLEPGSEVEEAVLTLVWAREQKVETYTFTRASVADWVAAVKARVIGRRQYSVGSQCTYCPRSHACEAMKAKARQDVAIFGNVLLKDQIERGLVDLPTEEIVSMIRRGKIVVAAYEAFREAVRRLAETSGPLDSGDGYLLKICEENGRREIDTRRAWPLLERQLTQDELRQVLVTPAGKLDDLVAAKAGRGKGAGAKRDLQAALVAAGAVTQGTVRKLKEVRKEKGET